MNEAVTNLDSVDIAKILKMLPHRYPFLMIDKVIDIRGNESGIGIKNVTVNEPQFQGHFPENPVFPGRADDRGHGADRRRAVHRRARPREAEAGVYFMTIDKAKFRKPVVPGDTIEYHMKLIAPAGGHVVVQRRGQSRAAASSPRPRSAP